MHTCSFNCALPQPLHRVTELRYLIASRARSVMLRSCQLGFRQHTWRSHFFLAGTSLGTPTVVGVRAAATTATLYDAKPSMAVMRIDSWCTSSSAPFASARAIHCQSPDSDPWRQTEGLYNAATSTVHRQPTCAPMARHMVSATKTSIASTTTQCSRRQAGHLKMFHDDPGKQGTVVRMWQLTFPRLRAVQCAEDEGPHKRLPLHSPCADTTRGFPGGAAC